MRKIHLKETLRFAHEGIRVVTYEAGENDMPEDAAVHVLDNELGHEVVTEPAEDQKPKGRGKR